MRFLRFLLTLVVLLLAVPLYAQQVPSLPPIGKMPAPTQQAPIQSSGSQQPPETRDPQALTVVQAAITALGGTAAIGQIQSWQVQAQAQGSQQMGGVASTLVWEQAGAEFRMASTSAATGKSSAIVTGHGSPASVQNGTTTALPPQVTSALFIPALVGSVLVNEFQNSNYSIKYQGQSTLNSKPVVAIRTSLTGKIATERLTAQVWYFDATTNLPVRVEYRLPTVNAADFSLPGAADLSNYQPVGGALYPFQIVTWRQGMQINVITLQSVNANGAISPTDFDATGGVQ